VGLELELELRSELEVEVRGEPLGGLTWGEPRLA